MTYKLEVVTPPDQQPVTLEDARLYARITDSDDDQLLTEMIKAATGMVQEYLRASLLEQTLCLTLDGFRDPTAYHDPSRLTASDRSIRLLRPPVTAIEQVTYWDGNRKEHVALDPSRYELKGDRLTPAGHTPWPTTSGPVSITYRAGSGTFETAAEVPETIRQAILRVTLNLYERTPGTPLDSGTQALLAPHRVYA